MNCDITRGKQIVVKDDVALSRKIRHSRRILDRSFFGKDADEVGVVVFVRLKERVSRFSELGVTIRGLNYGGCIRLR